MLQKGNHFPENACMITANTTSSDILIQEHAFDLLTSLNNKNKFKSFNKCQIYLKKRE
jgi:hypothetical protein